QASVMERLPDEFDKEVWHDWIAKYQPTDELRLRAAAFVASAERSEQKAKLDVAVAKWMAALEYPLSVAGLVISVLAIGHLLGGRPHAGQPTKGLDDSPPMLR